MCYESLSDYHTGKVDFSNAVVVVDEWAGVRAEIIGKSVMPEFERILTEAQTVVALDAFWVMQIAIFFPPTGRAIASSWIRHPASHRSL
ncbi:MAG: hypothetical protein HC781_22905 [Leptolyngbyaceae cyanobacterium CSU_1_4]|nr:hypothetical protein [Leptolyngbyaceae cyanobacterium CSU_1_4]